MYTASVEIDKNIHNLNMQITGWMSNNESSLLSENIIKDERFFNLKLSSLEGEVYTLGID